LVARSAIEPKEYHRRIRWGQSASPFLRGFLLAVLTSLQTLISIIKRDGYLWWTGAMRFIQKGMGTGKINESKG